jgi:4-diphosphocytidyl-2-C-methyl-D-erythritol kinase
VTPYPAPGKLNLFLHVIGRRADGYHLLQSVMRLLDFGDFLDFDVRRDGKIELNAALAGIPAENNLCVRAAALLKEATQCEQGATITLDKRLPVGGGMGGGSSDAATTLLALNRLWSLGLKRHALQELALALGADVPFFIFGRSAFAEGIGDLLQPVSLAPAWYVVLTPPVQVSTGEIFNAADLTRNTIPLKIADLSKSRTANDLQAVVCRNHPLIADYITWLKQFGQGRMTGSGACVFAEFSSEQQARAVLAQLPPAMQGFVAQGLDQHPLYDFAS